MSARIPRRENASRSDEPSTFNARRPVVLGVLTLLLLWGGLFGWGAFASISGAVIATGKVGVETHDQVVEHIDGGTVRELLVHEGDTVKAGDVVLRFDDTLVRSEEVLFQTEVADLSARRNRLVAESRNATSISWDPELLRLAETDAKVRAILDGQQRLFKASLASLAGQTAQFRERIGQTRKEIAGLKVQASSVQRQRKFLTRELMGYRKLFEQRLTELDQLLKLERDSEQLRGLAGDIAARMAGARGRIAEIEIAILHLGAQRVEEAEKQAHEVQAREHQMRERLTEVRRRLGSMEVKAPVSGEVYGMEVFALGEVVRPGEPILTIVPEDTELVVRAQLDPIHVDQVWPGQEAVLRFSAFPARTTPEFEGRIRRVAADTVHDEYTGLSWYEVEVTMGRAITSDVNTGLFAWMASAGDGAVAPVRARDLALTPGMPVEVHVRTGERSPLSYLAKPLTDYFSRSMREE